jgi:hypothetical protein
MGAGPRARFLSLIVLFRRCGGAGLVEKLCNSTCVAASVKLVILLSLVVADGAGTFPPMTGCTWKDVKFEIATDGSCVGFTFPE